MKTILNLMVEYFIVFFQWLQNIYLHILLPCTKPLYQKIQININLLNLLDKCLCSFNEKLGATEQVLVSRVQLKFHVMGPLNVHTLIWKRGKIYLITEYKLLGLQYTVSFLAPLFPLQNFNHSTCSLAFLRQFN